MQDIKVHFIDVGQADSIFIDTVDIDILIDVSNNSDEPLVVRGILQKVIKIQLQNSKK